MLQKESVSRRLESEEGISYTEFSYLLLQACDFLAAVRSLWLHAADGRQRSVGQHHGRHRVDPQAARQKAHGLVWPLMKTASGTKFGKTGRRATVWLDRGAHLAVHVLSVLAEHSKTETRFVSRIRTLDRRRRSRISNGHRRPRPKSARRSGFWPARSPPPRAGRDHVTKAGACVQRVVRRRHRGRSMPRTCWPCSGMCRQARCRATNLPSARPRRGRSPRARAARASRKKAKPGGSSNRAAFT